MNHLEASYDLIVVGSGIAGLATAVLAAPHARVLLLTKAGLSDSNTWHAQGGLAAAVGAADAPRLHAADTLTAGAGLAEPAPVYALTEGGRGAVRHLLRFGVAFDRAPDGTLALGREGAHGLNRILHAGGDATGAAMVTALERALADSRVDVRERQLVTALTRAPGGAVTGVTALDERGQSVSYRAGAVVLATGGAGQLYQRTTNPPVATADGLALAARAGATLTDLEFYQFHPTALALTGAPPFLISEAVRGEGAILRDATGRAFMATYHPLADLAPRDVVARAILAEMQAGGQPCVSLDLRHRPADWVRQRFPTIAATCAGFGLDLARDLIPVAPAAHYSMGGVRTDLWGATSLPGLYAAGEVACTGVHGANRLASNSLLEGVVFAERIVTHLLAARPAAMPVALAGGATSDDAEGPWQPDQSVIAAVPVLSGAAGAATPDTVRATVQATMWERAGLQRDGAGLTTARADLDRLLTTQPAPATRAEHETANLALAGRLLVEAALHRTESRGAHYRTDYPESSPHWRRHINVVLRAGAATGGPRDG
ncbi:MAG: L-aspartate oxidase [Chloroflexi bacterium]|nr:L-aspartate oxidase [Chloroflexota bacterium]